MHRRYPHLLSPIKVGNTTFRNRIITAPMTLHSMHAQEPFPTEGVITHFANKAKGGAACVTGAGVNIFPSTNDDLPTNYDVYKKKNLHYLAQFAECIHYYGAKASMELGLVGVTRGIYSVSEGLTMASGKPGKEMPDAEMDRYAEGFACAAAALKNAGFDMILLHFGHGLTMGQFLSPLTNKRKDRYGGSLENRARFPMMIIDRIRERVGRNLLIEVRISGAEFEPGGIVIEEAIEFVKLIQDKIDLIQVSAGMHNPKWMAVTHPSDFLPPMPNVFLAAAVKQAGVKIPVSTIGGIQDLEGAELIIAEGRADVVAIARGIIADPDLGEKAYRGKGEEVVPCIKCMRCHDSATWENRYVCSVNPTIGLEHRLPLLVQPIHTRRKVVVAGGGPAGMKAALIAVERGHEVVLFEKSDSLGGILKSAEYVAFKNGLNRFKTYLISQVLKSNIQVRLNVEATPELVSSENADIVIAALGAEPVIPPIPGVNRQNVITAIQAYGSEELLGQKVTVIGGGQVGCETALHLVEMGKEVTLVEMQDEFAPDATTSHRTELLLKLEAEESLNCLTHARCTAIAEKGISYMYKKGIEQNIVSDTVILAVGMRAREREAEAFRSSAARFVSIGDCVRAATLEYAMYSAFYAASQI